MTTQEFPTSAPMHVRPAHLADAEPIGQIQSQSMRHTLTNALGKEISPATAASFDPEAFAKTWRSAIGNLKPSQLVLVAVDSAGVRGFAAGSLTEPSDGSLAFTVSSFELADDARGTGHGAQLLNAVADNARRMHAEKIFAWLFAGDDESTTAFSKAGFEPAGTRQTFDIDGEQLSAHLWWASIDEED